MESLFENRYIRDEAIMKEFLRRSVLRSPIAIVIYILSAYYLLETAQFWFFFEYFYPLYLICAGFLLGLQFFLYHRSLKLTLKRDREMNQGQLVELHTIATDADLTIQSTTGATTMAYSSIKKVRQTKNLILLYTQSKLVWILPKGGFLKGTSDEFLEFLKTKGLKVK